MIHIKFEVEHIKDKIAMAFSDRNDEIQKMVIDELERQITTERVQKSIEDSVSEAIDSVISSIGDNYRIKSAISKVIEDVVIDSIKSKGE